MLEQLHGKEIDFKGSVLGFKELNKFEFNVVDAETPYVFLQSKEDQAVGFLVTVPFVFNSEYSLEIDDHYKEILEIHRHEDVIVLSIVTIKEPFEQSTMNLLAPIVINISNGLGNQIVLPPKCPYGTKEPLFKQIEVESGE
ncbi:flagellar assembly protein FliW [Paenibacillus albiflavus]|uniref:Flagellar assembly factor FliW n=1 Tax=Paenibacillus albiflavus TaxID=2545760 RepID=A0A4R4EAG2_9BACL|nr:flagellar assembly protein FliW [Paenibacillus albiflavus]TCZ76844.1 flagellar assembly protein FliW [Paenibacillus albiflavus]